MKVQRMINAAIGATLDRRDVTVGAKNPRKLNSIEFYCYKQLRAKSGPSAHNPIKVARSWIRAYHANIERQKMIEQLNAPFQTPSKVAKFVKSVIRKLGRK